MVKRKIKVHGKIKLYETSVVGIPAYPDAHASFDSFSLVKALSSLHSEEFDNSNDTSDELNLKSETMENSQEGIVEPAKVKTEIPDAEKNSDMSEIVAKAIKEGIKEGLKELEIERGFVDKQTSTKKSLGEMAMETGLFVK